MDKNIKKIVLSADSKALATCLRDHPNVVPVSSIKIVADKIWLINYFMDKTLKNILENKEVALVCWSKMMGYQIKGSISYETKGENFNTAIDWIKEILPEREVKGLLILDPREIYDISPSKNTKEKFSSEIS